MADNPEGIDVVNQDPQGNVISYGDRKLTITEIEILDLISEGEIDSLVNGNYSYEGTDGNIGWDSATFTPFTAPAPGKEFLRSVYWNNVPVINDLGQYNFQSVELAYTTGLPNGAVLNNFFNANDGTIDTRLSVARPVGERLRGSSAISGTGDQDYSKYYRILNKEIVSITLNFRVVQLADTETNQDHRGEARDAVVVVKVYYRPILSNEAIKPVFNFAATVSIHGKVAYGAIVSKDISFLTDFRDRPDFLGFEIKIVRVTPDSLTSALRNVINIDSIVEHYSSTFTYPSSAIVRSRFSAEFFSQVPERAFDAKLLKVKIPTTYDPIKKSYDEPNGYWDGSFQEDKAWTDNPAWCYYDLITNKRYGLGNYINEDSVDKFSLYEIAKYCDTLVSNGNGGLEPRFTCNLILNSRDEAWKVIQDMASIFRGLSYYSNGNIYAVQDSPKTPLVTFANASVENGDFQYSSSSRKGRHNVVLIRYNDPLNFYKPSLEYVEDVDGIRRYGIRQTEIAAFGCTSQGQAIRLGRWVLSTENLEFETINFNAGLEAAYLRPGDVFKVFDANRKQKNHGGRTIYYQDTTTGAFILLDREVNLDTSLNYTFNLLTPSFDFNNPQITDLTTEHQSEIRKSFIQKKIFAGSNVSAVSGRTSIQFSENFDTENFVLEPYQIWAIELFSGNYSYSQTQELVDANYDYYRVLNIKEIEPTKFNVIGLQYFYGKYLEIESGLNLERPRSRIDVYPAAPDAINLNLETYENSKIIDYNLTTSNYSGITSYRIFVKSGDFDDGGVPHTNYLVGNLPLSMTRDNFLPTQTGQYFFRAYGYNDEADLYSQTFVSGVQTVDGYINSILSVYISSLSIDSYTGTYGELPFHKATRLTNLDPTFTWQAGTFTDPNVTSEFAYRITVREPSPDSLPTNNIYYETTGVTLQNNLKWDFPFSSNVTLVGGPYRNYDVVVEAVDVNGNTSAGNTMSPRVENGWTAYPHGYDILGVNNPPISGIDLSSGITNPIGYRTSQFIDSDYGAIVRITGGIIPEDCIGGFFYASSIPFAKTDASTGAAWVRRTEFLWDKFGEYAYSSNAIGRYTKTGYMAISFYDTFDAAHKTTTLYTGLYVSNVVPVISSGDTSSLGFMHDDGTLGTIQTKVIDGVQRLVVVYNNGETGIF